MKVLRRCFGCAEELVSALSHEPEHDFMHPPSGALVFTAPGNYGSAVFDPGPRRGEFLEVSVCDRCLRQRAARVLRCRLDRTDRVVSVETLELKG